MNVALLRGVNVGGKNRLPMKDLVEMFTAAGCSNVSTYIQSGNVLFNAPASVLKKLPENIAKQIAETFGFRAPVILRTAEQMAETVRANPFLAAGKAESTLHVYFLAETPGSAAIAKLDPDRSPPDAFHAHGREIYLHLPNGMARTKLTNAYFDSKLGTVCTARNWATVLKLTELSAS